MNHLYERQINECTGLPEEEIKGATPGFINAWKMVMKSLNEEVEKAVERFALKMCIAGYNDTAIM